jgi:tetratricopeptide (TPR) repeat protein
LGVFCASLSLDAAEAVCGESAPDAARVLEQVTTLVDHSLLASEHGRGVATRYRLLETLRLFALDRLRESGEETATRCAHAGYFLDLAQESRDRLYGPDEVVWRRWLEVEEPNLYAALAWSAEHDPAQALRMAVALWPYWDVRWNERHGVAQLEELLTRPDLDVDDALRAWALTALAELAANPGEARRSVQWAVEAVAAFRRLGDEAGLARALFALGLALGNGGRLVEAEAVLAEGVALARRLDDRQLIARSLNATSYVATRRGQFELAVDLNRDEVSQWAGLGSRWGEATALRHLAVAEQYVGHLDEAERLCQRALAIWIELDDPASIAHVRLTLAAVARLRDDGATATALYDEALTGFRAIGDRRCTASTFKNQAMLAATCGEHARSSELFRRGIALRHDLGDEAGLAECLEGLACSVAAREDVPGGMERAVTMIAAATSIRGRTGATAAPAICESFEPVLGAGRATLGEAAYAAAVERGQRLSVPEVVAFALEL